ncbi:hypothetical protein [Actinomadura sp. CNU-125]|uniref:hypothetical protein n=1 Tax=Actinomadura sp. CNU-125 TaxID=1904961 RepID=UPI0021CCC51C|nr:hypothetical protein [Actinomadura sp. CNU-125]
MTVHRPGWALALLAAAQLIYSLDINIVYVALPELAADLGFSEQTRQWVVSAYVVFAGGFLLLGGRAPTCSDAAACSSSRWSSTRRPRSRAGSRAPRA